MKVNHFVSQASRLKAQPKAALFGTDAPDFSSTSVDARSVRLVQWGVNYEISYYLLTLMMFLFGNFLQMKAQSNNPLGNITPNGVFDHVYDRFGNSYPITELILPSTSNGVGVTETSTLISCTNGSGYFNLYFEDGCGMETQGNATHDARRDVICQVMQDLSNFIQRPSGTNDPVNIWVRNPANMTPTPPASFLGVATGFYAIPNGANVSSGIVDNLVWQTINSGTDAYTNIAPALSVTGTSTGTNVLCHGLMAFNFSSGINWDLTLNDGAAANEFDLYSVALHEMMHALGFASLTSSNGLSVFGAGYPYYSRYDLFLREAGTSGLPLITTDITCGLYLPIFQAPLTSISPGLCVNSGIPLDPNTCTQNEIRFIGNAPLINQAVYTPNCWEAGSSMSHLEDVCHLPISQPNNEYYVMSNANGIGASFAKRFPKEEEQRVLCNLGYATANDYGLGNGVFQGQTTYTSNCSGNQVVGIHDGINGGTYSILVTPGSAPTQITGAALLGNDYCNGVLAFSCLETVFGDAVANVTNGNVATIISLSAPINTGGLTLMRYIPVNTTNGELGNITYVYVWVSTCDMGSCTTTLCPNGNLVPNGGFEITNGCGDWDVENITVDCWNYMSYTPDIYNRGCLNGLAGNAANYGLCGIPNNLSQTDTWDVETGQPNGQNNQFIGLASVYWSGNASEAAEVRLISPMMPGENYTLTFWAKSGGDNDNFPFATSSPSGYPNQPCRIDVLGKEIPQCTYLTTPADLYPSNFTNLGLHTILTFPQPSTETLISGQIWKQYTIHLSIPSSSQPLNALWLVHSNYYDPLLYPTNSVQPRYFYLDDVVLTLDNVPTLELDVPDIVCADIGLQNLHDFITPPTTGGTFSLVDNTNTALSNVIVPNGSGGVDLVVSSLPIGTYNLVYNSGCLPLLSEQIYVEKNLAISKTANGTVFNEGDVITYTITVQNISTLNQILTDIEVQDVLPPPLTTTQSLTTQIPTLNPGDSYIFTIDAEVGHITNGCGVMNVENCATVTTAIGACNLPTACVTVTIQDPSITIFTNPNSATFGGSIAGQTVYISGVFSIDDPNAPFLIDNSTMIMLPGASIEIQENCQLKTNNTIYRGCQAMWRGINALSNATNILSQAIYMNACVVQDAELGITLNHTRGVTLRNSTFQTNVVGLFVPNRITGLNNVQMIMYNNIFDGQGGTFLPDYNGQLRPHGTRGFAGIELHDIGSASITKEHQFRNLNVGILSDRVNLFVSQSTFDNITADPFYNNPWFFGCGIYARGNGGIFSLTQIGLGRHVNSPFTFRNCDVAIFTERIDVNISNNHILDDLTTFLGRTGFWVQNSPNRRVGIQNNRINASSRGVFLLNNQSLAPNSFVSSNFMTIQKTFPTGWSAMAGIEATDASTGNVISNLSLTADTVVILRAWQGIFLNNVHQARLTSNIVGVLQHSIPRVGIGLNGANGNLLTCNSVFGNSYAASNIQSTAMRLSLANSNRVICNNVTQTYNGIQFNGPCQWTRFSANSIGTHQFGLHLSPNTIYGIQGNPTYGSGNIWTAASYPIPPSGAAAWHGNAANVSACLTYDLFPTPPPTACTPGLIFTLFTGSEDNCQGLCGAPTPIIDDGSTDEALATGNITFPEFEEPTDWSSRKDLYEHLADTTVTDSTLQAFMAAQANTSIAEFYAINEADEVAREMQASKEAEVSSLQSQVQTWLTQVQVYDSLLQQVPAPLDSVALVNSRSLLLSQLTAAYSTLKQNEEEVSDLKEAHSNVILTDNGEIDVTAQYETNEQQVNDIFYQTIGKEIYTLNAAQLSILEGIIHQCPMSGGAAVYRARALYAMHNAMKTYEDKEVCATEGIQWRQGQQQTEAVHLSSVELYPNPASETVTVVYPSEYLGFEVRFCTVLGQCIKTIHLTNEAGSLTTSVADLPSGVYSIQIVGQKPNTLKLVVTH